MPLFWITQQFGWRGLFFIVGGFGVLFGLVWWKLYRNPADSPTVNQAEIAYIEAGGGGEYRGEPVGSHGATSGALLRHRQVIGASIGQFGGNSTQVFFLTWFPTYLVTARGMTFIQAGFMTSLPYIGGVDRRADRRFSVRHAVEADRIRESGAQAADRRRHAARLDHRRGQLRAAGEQRAVIADDVASRSSVRA